MFCIINWQISEHNSEPVMIQLITDEWTGEVLLFDSFSKADTYGLDNLNGDFKVVLLNSL